MASRSRARRALKPIGLITLAIGILGITAFLVWCSILYPASPAEFATVQDDPAITVTDTPAALVLAPSGEASGTGLVFIPGAKVPAGAYANKLGGLARSGVTVVITKPILNLAFFDYRPLDTFTGLAADIDTWYVGGHSLGGVKACLLAADTAGLVLFGSYCANDLSRGDLRALSISGSDDGLTTPEDVVENAHNLPPGTEFVELPGANHASFGNYGAQPGDGTATATSAEVKTELTRLLTGFATGR